MGFESREIIKSETITDDSLTLITNGLSEEALEDLLLGPEDIDDSDVSNLDDRTEEELLKDSDHISLIKNEEDEDALVPMGESSKSWKYSTLMQEMGKNIDEGENELNEVKRGLEELEKDLDLDEGNLSDDQVELDLDEEKKLLDEENFTYGHDGNFVFPDSPDFNKGLENQSKKITSLSLSTISRIVDGFDSSYEALKERSRRLMESIQKQFDESGLSAVAIVDELLDDTPASIALKEWGDKSSVINLGNFNQILTSSRRNEDDLYGEEHFDRLMLGINDENKHFGNKRKILQDPSGYEVKKLRIEEGDMKGEWEQKFDEMARNRTKDDFPLKFRELPSFVSHDPQENADINDPGWNEYKNITDTGAKLKLLEKKWGIPVFNFMKRCINFNGTEKPPGGGTKRKLNEENKQEKIIPCTFLYDWKILRIMYDGQKAIDSLVNKHRSKLQELVAIQRYETHLSRENPTQLKYRLQREANHLTMEGQKKLIYLRQEIDKQLKRVQTAAKEVYLIQKVSRHLFYDKAEAKKVKNVEHLLERMNEFYKD